MRANQGKLLLSLLALFALAAAHPSELRREPRNYARSVYRPERAHEPPLTDGHLVDLGNNKKHVAAAQYKDLSAATQHLLRLYPPGSHYFIGLGRDPAPIIAFLQNLGGKELAINFPASSNESGRATVEILAEYVKKLLPPGILESGRTIVFVDATTSGRALDHYVPLIAPSLKGAKVIKAAFGIHYEGRTNWPIHENPGDKQVIDTAPFPEVDRFFGDPYEDVVAEYPRHGPGAHPINQIDTPRPQYQQYRDALMQRMERDEGLHQTLVELGAQTGAELERSIAADRVEKEKARQQREAKERQSQEEERQRQEAEHASLLTKARAFGHEAIRALAEIRATLHPTARAPEGQPEPFFSPNAERVSRWLIETLAKLEKYAEVDDQLKKGGPNPFTLAVIVQAEELVRDGKLRHRDHRRLLSQAFSASVMDPLMIGELAKIYEKSPLFRDTLREAPRFFTGHGKHEEPSPNIEANYRALMKALDPQFDIDAASKREQEEKKEKKG